MKNKNNLIKITFCILFILVVCFIGYLLCDKILNLNTSNSRYYQYYYEINTGDDSVPIYKSYEIELNDDNTAKWYFGGNASGGDEYIGTYVETEEKITLTLSRNMPEGFVCDDNQSVFPCNTILVLNKISADKLVSVSELGNDNISYTYTKTTKDTLKYIH